MIRQAGDIRPSEMKAGITLACIFGYGHSDMVFHVKRRGESLSYICADVFDHRPPNYVSREIKYSKHYCVTEMKKNKIIGSSILRLSQDEALCR